ncbi:MAG: hypothetical protein IT446_14215 [Phycisphaerales bacterium]|nr:hypothetical protein [Phycisphaerales bacterium]
MEFEELQKTAAAKGAEYRGALERLILAINGSECPTDPKVRSAALMAADEMMKTGSVMIQSGRAIVARESRQTPNMN